MICLRKDEIFIIDRIICKTKFWTKKKFGNSIIYFSGLLHIKKETNLWSPHDFSSTGLPHDQGTEKSPIHSIVSKTLS